MRGGNPSHMTWSQTFWMLGLVIVIAAIAGWFVARALGI
jgi:hypothetical protein